MENQFGYGKSMNNGIFFYSPFTDIHDTTYGKASVRLNKDNNITSEVINNIEHLNNKIQNDFHDFDKVLLVSHQSFNTGEVKKFGDNVYFYGAMTLNKNVILDFLSSKNISVTPYVYRPKSKDEIFEKLGERVVIKPNEYTSYRGHLVREMWKSHDDCPDNLNRWLFTKFSGKSDFPRVFRRVNCLFGESIFYYEAHHNKKHSWFNNCNSDVVNGNTKDVTFEKMNCKITIEVAKKVSILMSEYFGCGMVGCDFIVNDEADVLLCEVNVGVVAINNLNRLEKLDDRIDCGKSIYKSCKNILNVS